MNGIVLTHAIATMMLMFAIKHTKRIAGDVLYRKRGIFLGVLGIQFVFQLISDILIATVRQTSRSPSLTSSVEVLVILCHLFFDIYGMG